MLVDWINKHTHTHVAITVRCLYKDNENKFTVQNVNRVWLIQRS